MKRLLAVMLLLLLFLCARAVAPFAVLAHIFIQKGPYARKISVQQAYDLSVIPLIVHSSLLAATESHVGSAASGFYRQLPAFSSVFSSHLYQNP